MISFLAGMLTNFTGKDFPVLVKPPAPVSGGDTEGCKTGITGLYEFLVDNGYCMGADVADLGPLAKQAYHEEVLSLKGWQGLVGEAGAAPKGDGVKLSVTLKVGLFSFTISPLGCISGAFCRCIWFLQCGHDAA